MTSGANIYLLPTPDHGLGIPSVLVLCANSTVQLILNNILMIGNTSFEDRSQPSPIGKGAFGEPFVSRKIQGFTPGGVVQ